MVQTYLNVPYYLLNAAAAAQANGDAVALPANATMLTWQTIFGTEPASTTMQLLGSEDNVNWSVVDSSTVVGGAIRTITTALPYIKARIEAISGGAEVSVLLNAKNQ